jgi:hypothetical protein
MKLLGGWKVVVSLRMCGKGLLPALAAAGLLGGCASPAGSGAKATSGSGYKPRNTFCASLQLPVNIHRVAVLPLSVPAGDWQAAAVRPELESVLQDELSKARRFELVLVSAARMRELSGREAWRPEERLPHDLLEKVRVESGCEAVLFSHLQPYQAYRPLVVGWNFKLVDLEARQIVWSADEVFDASQSEVSKAAWRYYHGSIWPWSEEDSTLRVSPRRFSQFTLDVLFGTLPAR